MSDEIKNIFKVKNFGAINEANINITPLTIFVGPNNSGKSYLAMLYHIFTSNTIELKINEILKDFPKSLNNGDLLFVQNLITKFTDENTEKLEEYLENNDNLNSKPYKIDLKDIESYIIDILEKFYLNYVNEEIEMFFSGKINELINLKPAIENISNGVFINYNNIRFENKNNELKITGIDFNNIKELLNLKMNNSLFKINITEGNIELNIDMENLIPYLQDNSKESYIKFICRFLLTEITKQILIAIIKRKSYYIPVEKTNVIHDFKKILYKQSKNINNGYLNIQKNLAEDFLLMDYTDEGDFYNMAQKLENELFNGNIIVDTQQGFPIFLFYRKDGLKVPIERTSSSITELTTFILYLKNMLKKGDTIIIEEPESHLNPKKQRILVKYIVQLINQGLNIIFTTHSDYIIEQINNHLRLNNMKENNTKLNLMKKYNYTNDDFLDPENLSVYAFRKTFKEVEDYSYNVHKVSFNELGIEITEIMELVDDLYNESEEIIDKLLE
ncbi:MAG: AAA family ATPase [Methanobrevibacter sp.]|jgi:predicted ATPase|nr:AAA family ATPase [Candidatus Methanoflexus mossambicus]